MAVVIIIMMWAWCALCCIPNIAIMQDQHCFNRWSMGSCVILVCGAIAGTVAVLYMQSHPGVW